MKRVFLFLFFSYFASNIFAQSEGPSQFFLLDFEQDYNDTLWVKCQSPECQFYLNQDSIGMAWAYVTSPNDMISSLTPMGLKNAFLIQTHAGDGCPTLYQILLFDKKGKATLTDAFGNCNEFEKMTLKSNELQLDFPATTEPKRKKTTYKHRF